jgi:hypothetical protein
MIVQSANHFSIAEFSYPCSLRWVKRPNLLRAFAQGSGSFNWTLESGVHFVLNKEVIMKARSRVYRRSSLAYPLHDCRGSVGE